MECGLYSSNIDFTADTFISSVKKNEPITSNGYVIFNAPDATPLSDFTVINKDVKIKKDIETLQADVESVNNIVYNSNTAKYYQKGSAQKKFNKKICILAAGQSNCAGRIPAADLPEYISSAFPLENCQIISNKTSGTLAPLDMNTYKSDLANYWAFDLVTYYNIVTRTTNHIDVIKWAVGGTSIDHKGDTTQHWTADYEKIESGHTSLLQSFEEEIRNIIESNGSTFDIRAILWHQGEGDRSSLGTGSADRYYVNLRNLIAYIRGIVGNERLPFITGTVSHNSDQYDKIIESAQKKIESEDPYYFLIDMSGAPLVDKYHFDANSAEYFGQKAYDALIDAGVFDAEKINPSKPWAD